MTTPQDEAGVIAVLIERFEEQRLPRLLDIKAMVDRGEKLADHDLAFLEEVLTDAVENGPRFAKHPEYKNLAGKCSTCLRRECEAKTTYVIGVDIGLARSIRGCAHTWEAAWEQANRRAS